MEGSYQCSRMVRVVDTASKMAGHSLSMNSVFHKFMNCTHEAILLLGTRARNCNDDVGRSCRGSLDARQLGGVRSIPAADAGDDGLAVFSLRTATMRKQPLSASARIPGVGNRTREIEGLKGPH